jgi:arsenite-transporting ATPase
MDEWIAASERISRFLNDRAAFVLVATPESLVVNQTRRLLQTLQGYRVHVQGMVVNRIVHNPDSPFLLSMQTTQGKYVTELLRIADGLPLARLPLSIEEIKGRKMLGEIGEKVLALFVR